MIAYIGITLLFLCFYGFAAAGSYEMWSDGHPLIALGFTGFWVGTLCLVIAAFT
jgi:hypothetical protein